MQQRIAAANEYLETRPGTVGYVLRDRRTGGVYRNERAADQVWTASTIKLAMVAALFKRSSEGEITLSSSDLDLMQQMLHSSDNDAADALWFRYAGDDHFAYNNDFSLLGMTGLEPQPGFEDFYPYWGFQKCTPNDLDQLMQYVLTSMDAEHRTFVIGEMQQVDWNQQWGVWGAGPEAQPGNKDGWSEEDTGWVINSVGFAGPGQRYTLAIMNSLNGEGDYDDGVATESTLAELLLAGRSSD
ncbi:tat pathway signal sequence [Antrihabitans sp. YC2-6]|uniref:tat pathway signal sequence n=1 Tax=Antrihabitans sp. YC2-6 TaxID=2799498 RepID=UPI0018F5169A|nr:tat pathway signal sequence [Antrihabitans sp. YC2-6]MBJ8348455.1 tat pathway signal sequence [Antrihabitans sp. YC2-6]